MILGACIAFLPAVAAAVDCGGHGNASTMLVTPATSEAGWRCRQYRCCEPVCCSYPVTGCCATTSYCCAPVVPSCNGCYAVVAPACGSCYYTGGTYYQVASPVYATTNYQPVIRYTPGTAGTYVQWVR